MSSEQEKYPVDKRFRIKNAEMEDLLENVKNALEEHPQTRKYSDQATMELALRLANQKLKEIRAEKNKITKALP